LSLTAICGMDFLENMGNLKSYLMTLLAKLDQENGCKIYANYALGFDFIPITSFSGLIAELDTVTDAKVCIDEIQVYFDAYMVPSKKDGTSYFKNFARQTRKRRIEIRYTAQSFYDVHRSIRKVTSKILLTQKLHMDFTVCRDDNCHKPHIIKIQRAIYRENEGLIPVDEPLYMKVLPEIFDLYDTDQIIEIV